MEYGGDCVDIGVETLDKYFRMEGVPRNTMSTMEFVTEAKTRRMHFGMQLTNVDCWTLDTEGKTGLLSGKLQAEHSRGCV